MKINTLLLSMVAFSSIGMLSSCNKNDSPAPTPTCTLPAKPFDQFKLNMVGSTSHFLVPSNGSSSALTAGSVTATAYVLTNNQGMFSIPATAAAQTDLNGQASFVFNMPARLTENDISNILFQFTATPLTGGGLYQVTTVYGYSDIMNSLYFSYTEKAATSDMVACTWSGPDVYTVVYTQDLPMTLAPKPQQRMALKNRLLDLKPDAKIQAQINSQL